MSICCYSSNQQRSLSFANTYSDSAGEEFIFAHDKESNESHAWTFSELDTIKTTKERIYAESLTNEGGRNNHVARTTLPDRNTVADIEN